MNLNIQTPEGLEKVVAEMSREVASKIRDLEDMQRRIMEMEATFAEPGFVTLCDLPDVTDSTGKALSSSEKNAAKEGTMAYWIDKIKSDALAVDITPQCVFKPAGSSGAKIYKIPLLKIVFGAFFIVGTITNQMTIVELPATIEVPERTICGIGTPCFSPDLANVEVSPQIIGTRIVSSHSIAASVNNASYMILFKY